jgi:SAM-dependent methyltransferase
MQDHVWIERLALDIYDEDPFHVSRYLFAARYVSNLNVLDIACGVGFGTRLLKEHGASCVIGMDREASVLGDIARVALTGVIFASASATEIPLTSGCIDAIVSLETIEHITDYRRALREYRRTLSDGGILILSTPNAKITKPNNGVPRNPFHVREFEPEELREILQESFSSVELLGQRMRGRTAASNGADGMPTGLSPFYRLLYTFPLSWRIKLPRLLPSAFANFVVKKVTGHNMDIGLDDIEFSEISIEDAPVIVALCRKLLPGDTRGDLTNGYK